MKQVICEHCRKFVDYTVKEREETDVIDGKEITFTEEYGVCNECNKEIFVGVLHDRNIDKINEILGYSVPIDKNTHVYCTECRYGNKLIKQLMKDEPFVEPENCKGCNSYNPEDSMRFEIRPNYKKKRIKTLLVQSNI